MYFLFEKGCVLCLVKTAFNLSKWFESYIHVWWNEFLSKKFANFIQGPFSVNVRLPLANHIRHFCYTRQTTGITPLKSCVLWCWLLHPPVKVYICWCQVGKCQYQLAHWYVPTSIMSCERWVMGDEKRCEKVLCCEVLQSLIVCGHADEVWDGTRCRAGANGLWC